MERRIHEFLASLFHVLVSSDVLEQVILIPEGTLAERPADNCLPHVCCVGGKRGGCLLLFYFHCHEGMLRVELVDGMWDFDPWLFALQITLRDRAKFEYR